MIIAFLCGLLFGIGLVVSQMVDPTRVIGFLNITGDWDPTLAFVMAGALLVFGSGYWLIIRKREKPVMARKFEISANRKLDARLMVGAALFGIGWGLAGICPGPAMVNLTTGVLSMALFVIAMLVGLNVARHWR